ncbi:unnamed protein product [Adineta steineri]|uniref:StAR-related lipid transfer protein 3 n=1 Tax=Adineta steineri TaxID=433720 RepID=A0A815VVX6_9BILA|nr:unnamed protein product [Adineta steineri]
MVSFFDSRYESTFNEIATTNTLNQVNGRLMSHSQPQTTYTPTNDLSNTILSQHIIPPKTRMFLIRRTFLLIVTFDAIFMVLLWIIYNQIRNITIDEAFKKEVINYSIKSSLFDVVGLSGMRFIILMIPYAILRWSHWIFVAFTTLSSTGFILAKTCVFTIDETNKSATNYIILIASFILAWVEIWFFDYRVIPHERRLREALNHGERRQLIHSYGSGSISPNSLLLNHHHHHHTAITPNEQHQSFYSPLYSVDGSDTEDTRHEPLRAVHSDSNVSRSLLATSTSYLDDDKIDDYQNQANDTINEIWKIYKDENSWCNELKSRDGLDTVVSKTFPKWGKVFRLTGTVAAPRSLIVEMLFEQQDDIPKWNQSVIDCQILQVINSDLYISYQLTGEQAQGFITKRDFVNLTARRCIDGATILAAQACLHPRMPPKDTCVRAENGPTAYIIEKIDETTCKFTWLLNVNLKGWIPQYIINSALAGVQLGLVEALRKYISKTVDVTSSYSSSPGDHTI